MRLVFVLEYASFAGGMMSSSKELMKLFVKNDFEVHMLAPTSLPSVSGVIRHNLGGPIVLRKRNFISSIWSYVRINYILLNFLKKGDLVITNNITAELLIASFSKDIKGFMLLEVEGTTEVGNLVEF